MKRMLVLILFFLVVSSLILLIIYYSNYEDRIKFHLYEDIAKSSSIEISVNNKKVVIENTSSGNIIDNTVTSLSYREFSKIISIIQSNHEIRFFTHENNSTDAMLYFVDDKNSTSSYKQFIQELSSGKKYIVAIEYDVLFSKRVLLVMFSNNIVNVLDSYEF